MSDPSIPGAPRERDEPALDTATGVASGRASVVWLALVLCVVAGVALYLRYGGDVVPLLREVR